MPCLGDEEAHSSLRGIGGTNGSGERRDGREEDGMGEGKGNCGRDVIYGRRIIFKKILKHLHFKKIKMQNKLKVNDNSD